MGGSNSSREEMVEDFAERSGVCVLSKRMQKLKRLAFPQSAVERFAWPFVVVYNKIVCCP